MGMLTVRERRQLAELRRKSQMAPSPAEVFVDRMRDEVRKDMYTKRIERGIIALLTVLAGIVLIWLLKPSIADISIPTGLFWRLGGF